MYNQEISTSKQYLTVKSRSLASSCSTNYSTCSDYHNDENGYLDKSHSSVSMQSEILAGGIKDHKHTTDNVSTSTNFLEETFNFPVPNVNNDANYSISPLDQNLDCLTDNEVFLDCEESIKSDTKLDDSPKYLQLDSLKANNYFYSTYSNLNKLQQNIEKSNLDVCNSSSKVLDVQNEQERLITIVEETEVNCTNNSNKSKSKSSQIVVNNTGGLITNMVEQLKDCDNKTDFKINNSKRVLFAHKPDLIKSVDYKKDIRSKFIKSNTPASLINKNPHLKKKSDVDKNCNNHNTTESFILWEEYFATSEKLKLRKSLSVSDLNSFNDNYIGDDECSTSFKTLDDTFMSNYSLETISDSENVQKHFFRRRSKSCESVLKEVKHLPHILYDRFLKYLSKEIENIRKQRVICTCQRFDKNRGNKENSDTTSKERMMKTSNQNRNVNKTDNTYCAISPLHIVTNQTMLSTEILSKEASKSSTKMPITPSKKSFKYSWQKEIVSPVGEYIKGKRPSPFKSSPAKKII